jgi:tetratricopeptide (TPR) repeat protein
VPVVERSLTRLQERPKSNKEKIELAAKAKHQGNLCFKELDYVSAAAKYIQALQNFDQMWDLSEPQKREVEEIKFSCYLNLSMCYIKLGKYEKAIENCKMV